ncbi:SubName: Full=Related to lipase/esterase {ECO:0000313/EMBL:CCA71316.1} [Serendipita indica DSM 11827]|nr:SubName: Full=Related to lipase/esterase {ECO:0000313/EMBL:CCA71316.1} [Serendipita indica DSM 11827]
MAPTGLLAYLKLLFIAKIVRLQYNLKFKVGILFGQIQSARIVPFQSISIPSTKSSRHIQVNIYRTKAALETKGPVAVHLNWHGSGFLINSFGENSVFIEHLLNHPILVSYPLAIFDCDYAKAPEHPAPAATDDAEDVANFVLSHPEVYDTSRVTLGGFSAGAAIALSLSAVFGERARNERKPHPFKAVSAYYPVVQLGGPRADPQIPPGPQTWPGVFLDKSITDLFDACYFFTPTLNEPKTAEEDDARVRKLQQDPRISPARGAARDFSEHIHLVTCEYDHLNFDVERMRKTLQAEPGKHVYGKLIPGVGHSWDLMVLPGKPGFGERQDAYNETAKVIARAGRVKVDI